MSQSTRAREDIDLAGFWLQLQMQIGSRVVVHLGGRHTTFDQRSHDRLAQLATEFAAGETTPQAGLLVQPREWLSLYSAWSRSFTPTPTFDEDRYPYDPSFGEQVEVGAKAELLARRLAATVAVYRLDNSNRLSFIRDEENVLHWQQGGLWRSEGVEVDLVGRVTPRWSLVSSYSFMEGRRGPPEARVEDANRWSHSPTRRRAVHAHLSPRRPSSRSVH